MTLDHLYISDVEGERRVGADALPLRTVWDPLSRWEVGRLIQRERRPPLVTEVGGRLSRPSAAGGGVKRVTTRS